MDIKIKKYKKEYDYSYTLGMSPTMELIKNRTEHVYYIYVSSGYKAGCGEKNIFDICGEYNIPCGYDDKLFARIAEKGNIYIVGVFIKYKQALEYNVPHVMLVNPSDTGNLGTIIRTGLGFGFKNIAVIRPGTDFCDPKVIRASMGAIFNSNIEYFNSADEYRERFSSYELYPFMLDGENKLTDINEKPKEYTLVFGNEASGLPPEYKGFGKSVLIRHSGNIDSLNLSVAFGIAANWFYNI